MIKPTTLLGYSDQHTANCERVLVTLLRGLGPWKKSVYLVGGLTPRFLVKSMPSTIPAHVGTLDVDIVIDLQILTDTEGYHTLEENLQKMGFERSTNASGQILSWRWQIYMGRNELIFIELLTDSPRIAGGKVESLPTKGAISALNVPHASIVFDLYQVVKVRAELLGGAGTAVEEVRHANLVSFICLKAFAYDQRWERKDAYDMIYCIENVEKGMDEVAQHFREALKGKHGTVIRNCLSILQNRFAGDNEIEGYQKDGPIAVARFELGEIDEGVQHGTWILRQRQVSSVIEQLLVLIDHTGT